MAEVKGTESTMEQSGAQLSADIIDVLARGLDMAKLGLDPSASPDKTFCALFYGSNGKACIFFYLDVNDSSDVGASVTPKPSRE